MLWLELPRQVDAVELFYQARAENVGIAPGAIFSTQDKFANYVRITYGSPWSGEVGSRPCGRWASWPGAWSE